MIRASTLLVAGGLAVSLAACQTEPRRLIVAQPAPATPASSPMDGRWASTDGIFVASFSGGQFTSRFTKTNEILAQGSYGVTGNQVSMQWLSVAAQEQRSANCTIRSANSVHCTQAGGGAFDLRRV